VNESTWTQLKIIVERAVRPVRASTRRKRKIREELLAHVTSVFRQESAKLGDERTALEQTAQRFGNPASLANELQQSVPASDGIRRFLDGKPGEPALRCAVRLAMLATALSLAIFAVILFAGGSINVWSSEATWLSVAHIMAVPLYLFSLVFLTDWMRRALYGPTGRSLVSVARVAAGSWLVTLLFAGGLAVLPLLFGLSAAEWDLGGGIVLAGWLVLWAPGMAYALAQSSNDRIRYQQEWANLPIGSVN
jgi:hypothetical protein